MNKPRKADSYRTLSAAKVAEAKASAKKIKAGRDADQQAKNRVQDDLKKQFATKSRYR